MMSRLMMRSSMVEEVIPIKGSLPQVFEDDMVVTISKDGVALSRFGDECWDYSATSTSIKTLNFRKKIEKIDQPKKGKDYTDVAYDEAIYFLKSMTIYWVNIVGGCSMSKLHGDVVAATYLVCHCLNSDSSMESVFFDPGALDFIVERTSSDKQIGLILGKIQRFIDTAIALSDNSFWKDFQPSVRFRNKLKSLRKKFPETSDSLQTLLIPSNIYQEVIKDTIEDLERFLEHEESIKYLFKMRAVARDKGVALDRSPRPSQCTRNQLSRISIEWKSLVKKDPKMSLALQELYSSRISKSDSWGGVADTLGRWQLRCAVLIAAFTGMRKGELLSIPLNGLKAISTKNGDFPVVWSTTTKLEKNGAPHFTKWVTSSVVEIAFKVASIIAYGALSWSDDRDAKDIKEQEVPLFLSVENGKKGKPHPRFRYTATSFSGCSLQRLYNAKLNISSQDVAEISWFLYGENMPELVKPGGVWPLTFHQFRRSMAVYAAASGKVSYPALKAQLKHISMVMTVYYSDSNSRAVNILGDELEVKALREEWSDARARVEADDLFNLIESETLLAGSAGKRLRAQQARGDLPNFLDSRKLTNQAVKNGKIRYRQTLVGGCMSIRPCNKGAGVLASACISCENAVFLPGSKAALEETKAFYQGELAEGVPKRARQEYEENVRKIDVFLQNLIEATEVA